VAEPGVAGCPKLPALVREPCAAHAHENVPHRQAVQDRAVLRQEFSAPLAPGHLPQATCSADFFKGHGEWAVTGAPGKPARRVASSRLPHTRLALNPVYDPPRPQQAALA
jgi:hypothetical protein